MPFDVDPEVFDQHSAQSHQRRVVAVGGPLAEVVGQQRRDRRRSHPTTIDQLGDGFLSCQGQAPKIGGLSAQAACTLQYVPDQWHRVNHPVGGPPGLHYFVDVGCGGVQDVVADVDAQDCQHVHRQHAGSTSDRERLRCCCEPVEDLWFHQFPAAGEQVRRCGHA